MCFVVRASSVKQYDRCGGRYFVRKDQPIYGWWFYYMMSKIGPIFSSIHPKLAVRSAATVDELLACEVRTYVCIFSLFLHILHI